MCVCVWCVFETVEITGLVWALVPGMGGLVFPIIFLFPDSGKKTLAIWHPYKCKMWDQVWNLYANVS